ncbi:uncharacterized protein LOC126780411 [Nymphalis io]|uniref:uncharacterized protein LOC126780411 n=1 Tax=Inachis io TaxID=171585 RepID=UPI002168DCE2|nr:uncharacterized protein LOC126780411 [Nymphalis io]
MDPAKPNDPVAGASSSSDGLPPGMGIDDPADLQRILCIFKTLETIIKPIKTQADIMRNRKYYLATHFHRYKYISGVAKIPKPFPTSGTSYFLRPYGYWVRDPDYNAPPPDTSTVPMPFEIREGLDRTVATENIRKLFKELDDILSKRGKTTSGPESEANKETQYDRHPERVQDTPEDTSKDKPQDASEDTPQDASEDTPQDASQDTPQDTPKDGEQDYEKHLAKLLKGTKM